MWILEPRELDAAAITASSIVEDDAPAWSAGTYNTDDLVVHNHSVWEALKDGVTSEPSADVDTDWFRQGPTNKFRPFDQGNVKQAEQATQITYTIVPGVRIDALWFLDLIALSVRLEIVADSQTVYDETKSTLRSENRSGFYDWFFATKEYHNKIAFTELPTYADIAGAEFRVTIDGAAGNAKVGEILVGQTWKVGTTLYETAPRILNFSRDTRDEFGNSQLTNRRSSREISYRVSVKPTQIDYLLDRLERLTATKLVFAAGNELEVFGTTVFGTLSDLSTPIEGPNITEIDIQAKGFIA